MTDDDRPAQERDPETEEEAHEAQTLEISVVHAAICKEGEFELGRPVAALLWSALAAGLSMGFSMVAEGLLRHALPDVPWRPLVCKLGYSVGFLVVILGRQQLFTENTLTVILPLLSDYSHRRLARVARLWALVLAGNLVGAFLFALVSAKTALFEPAVQQTFAELGKETMAASFGTTMLRGVVGGWLIALMVWMLPASERGRVPVIVIVTFVVGLGHFAHVIAGSVDALFAVLHGDASARELAGHFLVPALLGNSLGGVALVAGLNHAQAQNEQPT